MMGRGRGRVSVWFLLERWCWVESGDGEERVGGFGDSRFEVEGGRVKRNGCGDGVFIVVGAWRGRCDGSASGGKGM